MILLFHFICLLARYIVTNISKSLSEDKVFSDDDEEDNTMKSSVPNFLQSKEYLKHPVYRDGTLRFFPPVCVQRYETVALILKDPAWKDQIKKVVDFGCSELGFFMYLKNIETITEILEVDIDSELLQRCSHKAAPLTCDYLMTKSNKPLDVYILAGSIADYDDLLIGCDAVVAIELIEHLSEECFKKMPYNIFHRIRPKLAIFTTPNADFNSLFPNFKDFRDETHRFEWTRKEFFDWTQEIIKLYPEYSARFYGIGAGPEGTENLGCCSQMVVFQRTDDTDTFSSARDTSEGIHNYKLIKQYKYPVFVDTRTSEEKIIHEIQYQVAHFNTLPKYYNYESDESEIPLTLLKEFVADLCSDDEAFRGILKKNGMILRKKNTSWYLIHKETESSKQQIEDEDWADEELTEDLYQNEDTALEEASWDDEPCSENFTNFKSTKSLEDLETKVTEHNKKDVFTTKLRKENVLIKKDEVRSAPHSYNHLARQGKGASNNNNSHSCKNNNDNDSNDIEGIRLNPGKSRIPRKRNENKEEKHSPERNFGKTSLSYKSQSSRPGL